MELYVVFHPLVEETDKVPLLHSIDLARGFVLDEEFVVERQRWRHLLKRAQVLAASLKVGRKEMMMRKRVSGRNEKYSTSSMQSISVVWLRFAEEKWWIYKAKELMRKSR